MDLINEPQHWRARAEEARILANQTNGCGSLRTMSILLRGPKTGPLGVHQIAETVEARGAIYEYRDGSVDRDSDLRIWFCAEPVGDATGPASSPTGGQTRGFVLTFSPNESSDVASIAF